MENSGHTHNCGGHNSSSLCQTLGEMDFERGIWSAALNGETGVVEKFLTKAVNVNSQDSYGYTALHYSCRNGHLEVCRLLLSHGADSNCLTRAGKVTPLQRAANKGHLAVVKLLLVNGATPELEDTDGKNALHKAAENGQEAVISHLMSSHPKLSEHFDNQGRTPRDIVAEHFPGLLHLFKPWIPKT